MCRDPTCCWRHWLSILSLALRSSPLLSGAPVLTCPSLLPYSVIRTQIQRFPEFGLGSFSKLLFPMGKGRLPGSNPGAVAKKVVFVCLIITVSTPDKYSVCVVKGPQQMVTDAPQRSRLIVQPCDECDYLFPFFQVMEHRWNENDRGKPKYSGKKPVPLPVFRPRIPRGLTRHWTRASAVTGRPLTAWAMARPSVLC
jgi:hypothetical protein